MLREYLEVAMSKAEFKIIDNPEPVFGEIRGCPGVWATGNTEEECRAVLEEALEEWVLLGIRMGHQLPEIDGIRIQVPELTAIRE
jgi:predicted RNase H-like HicB family nuclease